jgi:hypothetical protein
LIKPDAVGRNIPGNCAVADELGDQSWKQLLEHIVASAKERVRMAALCHSLAKFGVRWNGFSFENGDPVINIRENPGGHQPSNSRSNHSHL